VQGNVIEFLNWNWANNVKLQIKFENAKCKEYNLELKFKCKEI